MLNGCRIGESLLTNMAAISLDDHAQDEEAVVEKAPPVAFGAVVKQQHKWQVCNLTCILSWVMTPLATLLPV